jgi:hypothetical protein
MRLASVRLRNVGPFEDTTLHFGPAPEGDEAPTTPRPVTIVFGGDGTGKTTLLAALALTRPGYALPPLPPGPRTKAPDEPSWVRAEWLLGDDDPERPHPLVVASPSALFDGETPEAASARRREQAVFERRAQSEGGFVLASFSGARWFSRAATTLSIPTLSVLRQDVRQPQTFDDPTRADLTRETKQVLAYAAIGHALAGGRAEYVHLARFDEAIREVAEILLAPFGFSYEGISPSTLEPAARGATGRVVPFDALPRPARHLVSIGALSLRALFAAYPGADAPREREGVVLVDDIESQQDPAILRSVVSLLRAALPNVQWILTTASTHLAAACDAEVIALRRTETARVEIGEGALH